MNTMIDLITELNQNFNDLGEDLVLLESVLRAEQGETGFPWEYIASSLSRTADYVDQHTGAIRQLTRFLAEGPRLCGPSTAAESPAQ